MEENLNNSDKQVDKMESESATNSTADTQVDKPNYVPQGRVNEMTAKFKSEIEDLKKQIEERNKADKDLELAKLAEQGEQDKVIAQLKQELEKATPYVDKFKQLVNTQKAELLKDLPAELQEKYTNHDLDVVKDIHSAYTANSSKSNMVNSNSAVRKVNNLKANDVVGDKSLSWGEKLSYFKNRQK